MLTLQISSADYDRAISSTGDTYGDRAFCFVASRSTDATLLTFSSDQDALDFQGACGVPVTQQANPASVPSVPAAVDDDAP